MLESKMEINVSVILNLGNMVLLITVKVNAKTNPNKFAVELGLIIFMEL